LDDRVAVRDAVQEGDIDETAGAIFRPRHRDSSGLSCLRRQSGCALQGEWIGLPTTTDPDFGPASLDRSKAEQRMTVQWRNLILAATFSMMGATPDVAQTTLVPDLSGVYSHNGIPGFEPLASGPTSLVNLSRREGNVADNRQLVGDYRNPILKPETAEIVKKFGEMSLNHVTYDQPRNQCWPGGVPFELGNTGMQMLQTAGEVLILYRLDHQVRRVRMNASHPAHPAPSWYGDSIGHYEGDTLVVDTIGVKIGPYAMVDWYGTPHSPALHVVERYKLMDYAAAKEGLERSAKENFIPDFDRKPSQTSKYLQLLFTVEDPAVFTTAWSATVTYERMSPQDGNIATNGWNEEVCAENLNKFGTEKEVSVPTATKPDF
jgi:hypothetical protein